MHHAVDLVVPSSVVDGGRRVHDVAAEEDREGRGVEEGERVFVKFSCYRARVVLAPGALSCSRVSRSGP